MTRWRPRGFGELESGGVDGADDGDAPGPGGPDGGDVPGVDPPDREEGDPGVGGGYDVRVKFTKAKTNRGQKVLTAEHVVMAVHVLADSAPP